MRRWFFWGKKNLDPVVSLCMRGGLSKKKTNKKRPQKITVVQVKAEKKMHTFVEHSVCLLPACLHTYMLPIQF